eukprot:5104861-Amphidinium_carterae.1
MQMPHVPKDCRYYELRTDDLPMTVLSSGASMSFSYTSSKTPELKMFALPASRTTTGNARTCSERRVSRPTHTT